MVDIVPQGIKSLSSQVPVDQTVPTGSLAV